MPGKSSVSYGNLLIDTMLYLSSVTFPTLGANASATSTVTIQGILPTDFLGWNLQNPPAHLILDNIYVSAANTAIFTWSSDATGITGATVAMLLNVSRADGANLGIASIGSALV